MFNEKGFPFPAFSERKPLQMIVPKLLAHLAWLSLAAATQILAAPEAEPDGHTSGLRVGTAAIALEADAAMVIAGGILPGKAAGQEGKLRAVATVLAKSPNELAIVACDLLMLTREQLDPVMTEIQK